MSEEQTYDVAAIRNWCGVTHYTGCECHEKLRNDEVKALREENTRLKASISANATATQEKIVSVTPDEGLKSRSQIRRALAQNPGAVVKEMEALRADRDRHLEALGEERAELNKALLKLARAEEVIRKIKFELETNADS